MGNLLNRLGLFLSQIIFSIITPILLMPKIAKLRFTRLFIAFCFGRAYGSRYQTVIDSFQGEYGSAMAKGLTKAKAMAWNQVSVVADNGRLLCASGQFCSAVGRSIGGSNS